MTGNGSARDESLASTPPKLSNFPSRRDHVINMHEFLARRAIAGPLHLGLVDLLPVVEFHRLQPARGGQRVKAIAAGFFPEFAGYGPARREVKYGRNSRVDILLEGAGLPPCYVEVKNVHMMRRRGLAEFPDSVTARGAKHLVELGDMVAAGARAVMIYLIQMEAERFTLAGDIDKAYAAAFAVARARGVEAIAVVCAVTLDEINVVKRARLEIPTSAPDA